jgi:hypothetical protein
MLCRDKTFFTHAASIIRLIASVRLFVKKATVAPAPRRSTLSRN